MTGATWDKTKTAVSIAALAITGALMAGADYLDTYASLPEYAVPQKALNREQVSIAPPQAWLKRIPSNCGNVCRKCSASRS